MGLKLTPRLIGYKDKDTIFTNLYLAKRFEATVFKDYFFNLGYHFENNISFAICQGCVSAAWNLPWPQRKSPTSTSDQQRPRRCVRQIRKENPRRRNSNSRTTSRDADEVKQPL